jgi:hypothetical protein
MAAPVKEMVLLQTQVKIHVYHNELNCLNLTQLVQGY